MTDLTNAQIGQVYGDYITTNNNGQGLTDVLQNVQDGLGNNSPMQIATNAVNFTTNGGNTFQLDGTVLTANASNINAVCSSTPSFPNVYPLLLPIGTTAQRPNIPQSGMIWFNQDLGVAGGIEAYINGAWRTIIS